MMDSERDAIIYSGGCEMNDIITEKELYTSERTCMEIKPEPDSDDGLQNQIITSPYSLVEYKNPDVTRDDLAVDMKAEIKEETWWHGNISLDEFQPKLPSSSRSQIKNRDVVESLNESKTSALKNINETTLVPASYGWHQIPARIRPIKAPKYRSKDVAHAIGELRQLQESVNKHISQNQFDIFGRSVASQLKTIGYYKALLAQSQIQTLLTNIAVETFHSDVS